MRPTPFENAAASAARAVSLLTLALMTPSWAQENDGAFSPDEALTSDALVAWVLRENPALDAAEAAAAAAAYRVELAGSLDDPMLSLGITRSSERTIELSQPIPWPGTLNARESVARHESAAADWHIGVERVGLALAAKSAFAEWYFVTRALEINREAQGLVEGLIATAATRYAAGRALQQDVLQAEIERTELETRELGLLRQRATTQSQINALLNRSPDSPLPPPASVTTEPRVLDADVLERMAVDRHPELKRLDAEIGAADGRITLARKAFFPDFQLRAGYNEMWSDPDMRPMLGVAVNLPLDRGKRQAELDRARAERRRLESTSADARARLLSGIARARAGVLEALEILETYDERLVPLAGQYLDAAIADYRSGTGAFLNVVTAEQQRLRTELALQRTRADYLRRVAELESLIGSPLEAAMPARQGEEE